MKHRRRSNGWAVALMGFTGAWCVLAIWGCGERSKRTGSSAGGDRPEAVAPRTAEKAALAASERGEFPVPRPPLTPGIFPCSDCHDELTEDFVRRELPEEHQNIELNHGQRDRWCFDCHNPADPDRLRMAGGEAVPFTESFKLCGQCHGPKLRDWRVGVHGKRTGRWDGPRQYLLCVHCHDPHLPRFKPLEPMPPPRKPSQISPLESL